MANIATMGLTFLIEARKTARLGDCAVAMAIQGEYGHALQEALRADGFRNARYQNGVVVAAWIPLDQNSTSRERELAALTAIAIQNFLAAPVRPMLMLPSIMTITPLTLPKI